MFLFDPILYRNTPEPETEAVRFIQHNLDDIAHLLADIECALDLYIESSSISERILNNDLRELSQNLMLELDRYSRRRIIAARSFVLSVFGFGELIGSLNKHVAKCPSVKTIVTAQEAKLARELFEQAFPDIAYARIDAAHPGELAKDNQNRTRHSTSESKISSIVVEGGQLSLGSSMINDAFSATVRGRLVTVDITQERVAALHQVCRHIDRAFEPVRVAGRACAEKQGREKL